MAEVITEIVLHNGMMMAVYGTRKEVMDKLYGTPDNRYIEFLAHSFLNETANKATYNIRASEILMVGVERDPKERSQPENVIDFDSFLQLKDTDIN